MQFIDLKAQQSRIRKNIDKRMLEVLDVVGLADRLDQGVGTLSSGLKHRLAIAITLLKDPSIISRSNGSEC